MDNEQIWQLARGEIDDASRILCFSMSFDTINAAVSEHLDRARAQWRVNVTNTETSPKRACYTIEKRAVLRSPACLLALGEVRVRERHDQEIELRIVSPPRPDVRSFTQDEQVSWLEQPKGEARDQAFEETYARLEAERDEYYQEALMFHHLLMVKFLQSLLGELAPSSDSETLAHRAHALAPRRGEPPDAPKPEDYNTMMDFYDAMCDYYETIEKPRGVKIRAFAISHGIEPDTFYKRRYELHRTTPRTNKKKTEKNR